MRQDGKTKRTGRNACPTLSRSSRCLSLAVADVEPAGAVALAAPSLILVSRTQAGGTGFPIGFVQCASIHAGAALACGDLYALAIDQVRGVRDGPAAGADSHGLWFLVRSLVGILVRHGCAQPAPITRVFPVRTGMQKPRKTRPTRLLEEVPEELVVDFVVELDFLGLYYRAERARAAVGGGAL